MVPSGRAASRSRLSLSFVAERSHGVTWPFFALNTATMDVFVDCLYLCSPSALLSITVVTISPLLPIIHNANLLTAKKTERVFPAKSEIVRQRAPTKRGRRLALVEVSLEGR